MLGQWLIILLKSKEWICSNVLLQNTYWSPGFQSYYLLNISFFDSSHESVFKSELAIFLRKLSGFSILSHLQLCLSCQLPTFSCCYNTVRLDNQCCLRRESREEFWSYPGFSSHCLTPHHINYEVLLILLCNVLQICTLFSMLFFTPLVQKILFPML